VSAAKVVPARRRPATWLALALLAIALGSVTAGVLVAISPEASSDLVEFGPRGWSLMVLSALAFAGVGALVVLRLPSNTIGWLLLGIGLCFGIAFAGAASTSWEEPSPVGAAVTSVGLAAWYLLFTTLVPRLLLVIPDGQLPTSRWRLVNVIHAVLLAGGFVFLTSPNLEARISETSGVEMIAEAAPLSLALSAFLLVAGGLAMLIRLRRSVGIERLQMKWIALAGLLNVAVLFLLVVAQVIAPQLAGVFGAIVVALPPLLPIAIGIAILRYRLYDIDRLISRTIGWALVTGILGAVFVAIVLALQALLAGFTQGETLAVAASTLAAFALFQPLRRPIQAAVDRRFDRARYDGQQTVDAFAEELREKVEFIDIDHDLHQVIHATVRPAHVGVWLRERQGAEG
jgi:hypothetical protein